MYHEERSGSADAIVAPAASAGRMTETGDVICHYVSGRPLVAVKARLSEDALESGDLERGASRDASSLAAGGSVIVTTAWLSNAGTVEAVTNRDPKVAHESASGIGEPRCDSSGCPVNRGLKPPAIHG